MIVAMIVVGTFMRSTRTGRELYAIGSNPDAATLAGIRVTRRVLGAFTAEIDTRPGPLTALLTPGVEAGQAERSLAAVGGTAGPYAHHAAPGAPMRGRVVVPRAVAQLRSVAA